MQPLLERGRQALRLYIASLAKKRWPIGGPDSVRGSIDIVTHADFVLNAALCLRHVVNNSAPTHILSPAGAIIAIIAKHSKTW